MKRVFLLAWILSAAFLNGQQWQIINNVNHVYDIDKEGNNIYFSSWGGVTEIEGADALHLSEYEHIRQLGTGDGLVSNDIRNLALINFSESLWMGSSQDGISSLNANGILNVDEELGLPSSRVNRLLEVDSRILVATEQGLSVFYYLDNVSFPLILHQYNSMNTGGGLPSNNISDMVLSDDNILYMAHELGVSYVPLDSLEVNSAWKSLSTVPPFPINNDLKLSTNAEFIVLSAYGRIWIGDPASGNWQVFKPYDSNSQWPISAIHLDGENKLWVAYGDWDNDLLRYDSPTDTLLTRLDLTNGNVTQWKKDTAGFGFNHVSRIKEFDGYIYICTWGDGIARFRDDEWEYYNPDNIAFPKITMSKVDQNNALWFASGIIGDNVVRKGTMGVSAYKDGHWLSFNRDNSPLHSNNILNLEVDGQNRKWFGAWWTSYNLTGNRFGLSIYDEPKDSWLWMSHEGTRKWDKDLQGWGPIITGGPNLLTSTIGGIYRDLYDNMFVLSYDGGINVLTTTANSIALHSTFHLPNAPHQRVLNAYHNGRQYFFGTEYDNGLSIWNNDSIPVEDGGHWLEPGEIVPELREGKIYGVASVEVPHSPSGWQHFVASGTGLYMWDEYSWYKYDVYIKRYRYDFTSYTWVNDTLYYADEERIFGSKRTYPLSIYGDPFGRIWIGSEENGLSMYDPIRERFTNYYQGNSPLLSNQIISLGYDPLEGRLLIGTTEGLNTLRIGRTVKPETDLETLKAFPNPFRPDGHTYVQIVNLPKDSMPAGKNECRIYSASGQLVKKLDESPFSRFEWDGKNNKGTIVSSGIYFFVVTDSDGKSARGKIAVIR